MLRAHMVHTWERAENDLKAWQANATAGPHAVLEAFAGEPHNNMDGIFTVVLLLEVQDTADGKAATFNFFLEERTGG